VGKEKLYSDYTLATSTPYCPTSYAYCYGITTQYVQTRILDAERAPVAFSINCTFHPSTVFECPPTQNWYSEDDIEFVSFHSPTLK
jgi:hypothetical protein